MLFDIILIKLIKYLSNIVCYSKKFNSLLNYTKYRINVWNAVCQVIDLINTQTIVLMTIVIVLFDNNS